MVKDDPFWRKKLLQRPSSGEPSTSLQLIYDILMIAGD
jgi:hypothetical protein